MKMTNKRYFKTTSLEQLHFEGRGGFVQHVNETGLDYLTAYEIEEIYRKEGKQESMWQLVRRWWSL